MIFGILFFLLKNEIVARRIEIKMSKFKLKETFLLSNEKGLITPVIPMANPMLNILLPTTFPNEMSGSFLKDATIEVNNSGRELPTAIKERPITSGDIPKYFAICTPLLTDIFAPI